MSISIKNLSKNYDGKNVLSNISLLIGDKEKVSIMGPSGCGKTTLIRIIAGLETADSGEVQNTFKKISFVFQENRLCDDFSALSNVKFVTGKSKTDLEIYSCLAKLGLGGNTDTAVKNLSGGMKRRVAIARALLSDYDLLIMDEPFKGLDEKLKISVMKTVKEAVKDKTVIFVTHDAEEATFLTERVIKMDFS